MKKRIDLPTELNRHDREILKRYTGFHTNMIESNTAKKEIQEYHAEKDENE